MVAFENRSAPGVSGRFNYYLSRVGLLAFWLLATPAWSGPDGSAVVTQLPVPARPFPEPPAAGREPGFKFRGSKGWGWTPEQYLEEIPWLQQFKMNFLMNCYSSLFVSNRTANEWWKPLPAAEKAAYAKVFQSCRDHNITFCFCMNPQLDSRRPLNGSSAEDLDLLYRHYAWAQSQGVRWFSICVDDAGWGGRGPVQAATEDANMVNNIFGRLREKDSQAQLIFCPGPYWGDGSPPDQHAYLQQLGHDMNPDAYVFWTGDVAVTGQITTAAARSYRKAVNHRLFLWDNYPVNDSQQTLHLGPVSGRAADLCDVVDGYMSNPMEPQSQMNRLPLATCADYAYNPADYDPARSIGRAVALLGRTASQQQVLKDLVAAYPGFIATGGGTGNNPVRNKFNQLLGGPDARDAAGRFLFQMESLFARFERVFPGQFDNAKQTVAADVAWMREKLKTPE